MAKVSKKSPKSLQISNNKIMTILIAIVYFLKYVIEFIHLSTTCVGDGVGVGVQLRPSVLGAGSTLGLND